MFFSLFHKSRTKALPRAMMRVMPSVSDVVTSVRPALFFAPSSWKLMYLYAPNSSERAARAASSG